MSDNPFRTPEPSTQAVPATYAYNKPAPGALTPICIICLILGLLGFGGSCVQGIFLPFQGIMQEQMDNIPAPAEQKAIQELQANAQKTLLVPTIILLLVNLVVAGMLIIGSIGGLQRKMGGHKILSLGLLAAIFYSLLKIGITAFWYFATSSALAKDPVGFEGDAEKFQNYLMLTKMITAVSICVGIVMALALMGFYIWARTYVNKPHVVEYFATSEK